MENEVELALRAREARDRQRARRWTAATENNDLVDELVKALEHLSAQNDELKASVAKSLDLCDRALKHADELTQKAKDLQQETEELNHIFEMRHAAYIRAVALWKKDHPERELRLPNHADLVCYFLSLLEEAEGIADTQERRADKAEALNRPLLERIEELKKARREGDGTTVRFVWEPSEGRPQGSEVRVQDAVDLAPTLKLLGMPWLVQLMRGEEVFWSYDRDATDGALKEAGAKRIASDLEAIAHGGRESWRYGSEHLERAAKVVSALRERALKAEAALRERALKAETMLKEGEKK